MTTRNNALAETTIGLYKNECVRADSPFRRGPLRNLADVEYITADYVAWYNQQRLMHRLGRVPPAEAETQYYSEHVTDRPAGYRTPRVHETSMKPGMVQVDSSGHQWTRTREFSSEMSNWPSAGHVT